MAQNAENSIGRHYLKRKALVVAGVISGFGIMGHGMTTGPSDEALDYKIYARNIDGVIGHTEQFKTEKGEQAVILLQGVKEELEKNPDYKNVGSESKKAMAEVIAGTAIAAVSLIGGSVDYLDRRRREMYR